MIDLFEGKIDSEYEKDWNGIPREIFDQIISLDPQTNVEQDRLGPSSKQLLLPNYLEGETAFLDDAENVKAALQKYTSNRGQFPQPLRNIAAFPSVKDFVDYVLNGEESEFAKQFDLGAIETPKKEKENKLDTIYNKYYNKLPREEFDQIIALDPETTENSIGQSAKNLLLPRALQGEKVLDLNAEDIKKAIIKFNSDKSSYPEDKRQIEKFDSVAEFIEFVLVGPETNYLKKLKSCEKVDPKTGNKVKDDINIIGSTAKYDIIQPLSWTANVAITCNCENRRHGNEYFTWCTGWADGDGQWNNHSSNEYIYCFIDKSNPTPTSKKDRESSYQLAITKRDSKVYQFLDGNDNAYGDFNAGSSQSTKFFKDFLMANPDVCTLISTKEHLKDNPQVQEVMELIKYSSGQPFVCSTTEECKHFKDSELSKMIKKIVIKNITYLPAGCFAGSAGLEEVQFNPELKVIGAECFMGCFNLNNITLPDNLEKIGAEAFAQCLGLKNTIRIPDSLTVIGREAFRGTHCKLSINKNRKTKLEVDVADRAWFISHAKAITVQEGLEEDMDITEEILDEKIPSDLARAYQNSQSAVNGIQNHPRSNHNIIGGNHRREISYDYEKATYEEISKEEAIDYLGLSVNVLPDRDENGKIVAKVRTTDRELFNERISDLRFIIGNKVIEYEVRSGNALYLAYWMEIPQSKFGDYPLFKGKGYDTTDCRFANKYSDIYTIIQISDKIYKTDEYEFEITNTTPTGKKIRVMRKDSDGNPVLDDNGNIIYDTVDDTIQNRRNRNKSQVRIQTVKGNDDGYQIHNPASSLKTRYIPTQMDTGAHNPSNAYSWSYDVRSTLNPYLNALNASKEAFKKYDYLRSYLKKVESEREFYDEEEYNDLVSKLKERKEEAYQAYLTTKAEEKKQKQKLILDIDNVTLSLNKRFINDIQKLDTNLKAQHKNNEQQSTLLSQVVVTDSDEVKDLERKIQRQKQKVEEEQQNLEQLKERKADLLRRIDEIKQQIESGTVSLDEAVKRLQEVTDEMNTISDTVMRKKFERIDQLKAEAESLQTELDELAPRAAADRAARAAKNKEKELDSQLSDILVFTDTTAANPSDSAENN